MEVGIALASSTRLTEGLNRLSELHLLRGALPLSGEHPRDLGGSSVSGELLRATGAGLLPLFPLPLLKHGELSLLCGEAANPFETRESLQGYELL